MHYYLKENIHYLEKIKRLKIATGKSTLNKIELEGDDITFYSKLSEIKFGHILLEIFGENLEFEPKIFGKTPDWLVNKNSEKIIFEVLRINPPNEIFLNKIEDYKNEIQNTEAGFKITQGIFNDSSNIFNKVVKYQYLIEKRNYKLVICIDASSNEKLIDIEDINDFFDYCNITSSAEEYKVFVRSIAGLIVIPWFGKTEYINNDNSERQLNILNKELLFKEFKSH